MTDTALSTTHDKPPLLVLRERLEQRKTELRNALPSDVSPDVFIRAVTTSAQLNPEILACSWQTIWTASLRACRDGLLPDGTEGAIVPYKSTATWIPMYAGLLRRFRRSGQFKWVTANVVREGEVFEHWITNQGEHFKHIPGDDTTKPVLRAYALATTLDGGEFCTVLSLGELNKIRAMSRTTREDAPWKVWTEAMFRKSAIRQLAKYLPSARDLIGDEDMPEPPDEPAAPFTPDLVPRRPAGAAAALQQFAGSTAPGSEPASAAAASTATRRAVAAAEEEGGAQGDAAPAAEDTQPSAATATSDAPAATDPITVAHRRGQEARAAKLKRSAMPEEYRAVRRLHEWWLLGFDDKPKPDETLA